jgi:hypothetical protein
MSGIAARSVYVGSDRRYPEVLGGWGGGHTVLLLSGLRIVHQNDSAC